MSRRSWMTTAVAVLATLAIAPPVFAEETPDAEEVPDTVDPEGSAEYRDVREMQELEEESFEPAILGRSAFDAALVAPSTGTLVAAQRDAGRVPEIESAFRKARVGSELLAIPAVRERFEHTSMLGLTIHDEPGVRAYLDFFDGRGKKILARWLERMGKYKPLIEQVLREEALPPDLIYVAMIESGFSPYATSPAAAAGVWQFIPTTGTEMGLRIDYWVDERRDPVKATRAAAKYLAHLHDKFGSWPLALAAYNGGPGLVAKEIGKHNSNNYWRIRRLRGMYKETRRYVPKIIAAGLVAKNADIFGLDHVEPVGAERWTEVSVGPRTRLSLVADACGVDFDIVKDLNPALIRRQTPPGTDWKVRIPHDRLRRFTRNFDNWVERKGAEHVDHEVAFGETLDIIGAKYGIAPRVIRVANGLEKRDRVSWGDTLAIPRAAMGSWKPKGRSKKQTVVVANAKLTIDGKAKRYYRVREGDTLGLLGQGLGVRPSDVVLWNDLDPKAKLQEGMVLQLFVSPQRPPETLALMSTDDVQAVTPGSREARRLARKKRRRRRLWYRVRSGDSLWIIARKYKVTVGDLKKWNRKLRRSSTLQPGQKLVVYPGRR